MKRRREQCTAWLVAIALIQACAAPDGPNDERAGQAVQDGAQPAAAQAARSLPVDPVARGRVIYSRQCQACHGPEGRGDGEAAYLLYPKPRDLVAARYRVVSTWEGIPTDEDLFRTISRGMPGSAMPSWGHLPEEDRRALVAYVKSLAAAPLEVPAARPPAAEGELGSGVIAVPPEPSYDDAARAQAQELFAEACASCHGASGRGDGSQEQIDAEGYATRPRDLTEGVFKGDPSEESVYRRIIAGIPGSPMPASDWAYGDRAWHLVHLVRSLSSDRERARAEMQRLTIPVRRVASLPDHPDAGLWAQAAPANLHLMPLWWRADRPEELTVRALHDGRDIALQLIWRDSTYDATALRPQDFRDAAAVQLSADAAPPFFAMGQARGSVDIWMWKSERQADLEPAFQDLEKIYPNLGIDSYPNLLRSAVEQPHRHALTLESDPAFVTAWGAGNIVADPTRMSAVEALRAQGFGTLRARPPAQQTVSAKGVYGTDSYRVMLRRPLIAAGDAVALRPGSAASAAFAVWDGAAGDRDGKKSVTIWQRLDIEE